MKIAGLDIGTTGCKLTVFDRQGDYLDAAYRDYPAARGKIVHTIDAAGILKAVFEVIRKMAEKYPDISGIGVTSFGETFILTDERGAPLHDAMLYTDPRGAEECRSLTEKLGSMHIALITGLRPHAMYSIPKMMWMKRNQPEIYKKAVHAFQMQDFIVYHLTGKAQIDYSLASRSMGFDINSMQWSREIFGAAGLDMNLMPNPVPSGTAAGGLLPEIADETGLSKETVVVSVSHDQVAAAVGAGIFDSDTALDGAGTVECIAPLYDSIPNIAEMYEGYYSVVPYAVLEAVPQMYTSYAFSYTGGALIQWCIDTLAKKEKELAKAQGISVYSLLENSEDAPTGLLVLPHFAGAATPYMDTGSKGAVLGLTTATTIQEIYRACMEGVVYEMRLNLDRLPSGGKAVKMLHATGGGAKSSIWLQMKADILNIPVTALETADAGTVGSAMLTAVAVGCFENLEAAAGKMVKKKRVYTPREDMHRRYSEIYKRYCRMYQAVRPLMGGESL